MTKTMADLNDDLVSEILSRVPITSLGSVRSTCKKWNTLSKNRIFGKAAKNQFLGFIMKDLRICSVRIDLNDGDDFIDASIKQVSVLNEIEVARAYHCDGLLLCFPTDNPRLLVWNPYLGQMRSIPHRIVHPFQSFVLGYDNDHNYKILEILESGYNIYDFSSDSWRCLDDVSSYWKITVFPHGVTLKGNAYFYVQEDVEGEEETEREDFLLCFDFTSERFGSRLSLPFHHSSGDNVTLSCVRDEKLAVFYQSWETLTTIEIWVTNKINDNEVSWTKCLDVNMNLLTDGYRIESHFESFFIDEENKVVMVFDQDSGENCCSYQEALIIGQNGYYFKSIDVGVDAYQGSYAFLMLPLLCSSYVPNLVQI